MTSKLHAAISEFFPVPDQRVLRDLCGPEHRHLAMLETALKEFSLQLDAPGGGVTIRGEAEAVAIARATLAQFSKRLQAGLPSTEEELRACLAQAKFPATAEQSGVVARGWRSPVIARSIRQQAYLDALRAPETDLVFGSGPAGTGKTFLAVAVGVAALLDERVKRLIITRPAVEAGERLGFLPGDLADKVDPYLKPIWDALGELLGPAALERKRANGQIEIAPLAFMRGRTLRDAFVLIDEAQNATRMQMKMVLTRLGSGSKMVVTGDPSQIDLPHRRDSGLVEATQILSDVAGIQIVHFEASDIVRHPLVSRIVAAYDEAQRANANKQAASPDLRRDPAE